ncbi:hypothetical protein M513_13349 [Trichuris suis]|uniref:Reverse transcriptase domain-containing protein n=1 Tax=Trichuris suis TaxID=68888 RepID=A0A085LLC5_9BILA|nr:hypothetical protein M513_13349 [Trichuris suis]
MDYPAAHAVLDSKSDRRSPRSPRTILTPFGWTVVGPLPYGRGLPKQPHCYRLATNDAWESPATDQLLDRFFSCELMCSPANHDKPISLDEKRAWRILKETTRFNGQRYQAGLLWARDQPGLPVNRVTAVRRFSSLERRLNSDAELCAKYVAAMQEYIAAGHARKLSPEEVNAGPLDRTWWLPHHPVINPNKPSKLRIVFDAAATFKGVSLNSALLKAPDLTANMTSVLLRFRLYPVAVSSDIIKMFHQVMVQPPDRSALRFVWKETGSPQPLCDYQMMVQIFGATCSPTICAYTLRKAAMDSGEHADLVMRQVINHFYVDNWLASFRSEADAAQTLGVVTRALGRARGTGLLVSPFCRCRHEWAHRRYFANRNGLPGRTRRTRLKIRPTQWAESARDTNTFRLDSCWAVTVWTGTAETIALLSFGNKRRLGIASDRPTFG